MNHPALDENILTSNFKYQDLQICNKKYIVAVRKKNDIRQILVTDLINFYEENLSRENILKRCMELNPALIDFNFEDIIDNLLINISKYTVSSTVTCIQLENKIDGGRFFFHVNLTKSSLDSYQNELINQFYYSFFEIQRRYNYLLNIVKKKDQELTEYKSQGIEIPRKNLLTEPFDEEVFTKNLESLKNFNKLDIFLSAMKFYSIIENELQSECTAEETTISKESNLDKVKSKEKSRRENRATKRPSSDIRCAVPPKTDRKIKIDREIKAFLI